MKDQIIGIMTIPIEEHIVNCAEKSGATKKFAIEINGDNQKTIKKKRMR